MPAAPDAPPPQSPSPRERMVLGLGLALWLLWVPSVLTDGHSWGDDHAGYLLQARALVEGRVAETRAAVADLLARSDYAMGPVAYPWGYPLLLAPVYAARGLDLAALKGVGVACFGLGLVVYWTWLRRRLPPAGAGTLVVLVALFPPLLAWLDQLMSELPFLLATALFLDAVDRADADPPARAGLRLGATIFLAAATRWVGTLHGLALALARRAASGREHATLVALSAATALGLLGLLELALPAGTRGYDQWVPAAGPAALVRNLPLAWATGCHLLAFTPAPGAALALVMALLLVGLARAADRDRVAAATVVLGLLATLAWPWQVPQRALLPYVPWLAYFAVQGLGAGLVALAGPDRARRAGVVLAVLALALMVRVSAAGRAATQAAASARHGPAGPEARELFAFVAATVPPGDTVAFFKPRAMLLATGRKAVKRAGCEAFAEARWVVLERRGLAADRTRRGAPRIEQLTRDEALACRPAARVAFENPGFLVLEAPPAAP